MNFFSNQKTWFFIALFFIIVNVVLVAGFFMRRHNYHNEKFRHVKEGRAHASASMLHAEIIADSLNFSEEQKSDLKKIEAELDARKDNVFSLSKNCKKAFTRELYSENPDSSKLDSLTNCISSSTELYNKIRIEKIFGIRSICTPEQLKKFNVMLSRLAEKHYHNSHH